MKIKTYFSGCLLILLLMFSVAKAQAQIVVITHGGNKIHGLTMDELGKIYLGKVKKFSNGKSIHVANQPVASQIRKQFCKKTLNMSADKVDRYWAKRKYIRNVETPRILKSDAAVKSWIGATPNSLGYIDSRSVDSSVKILLILP